MRLEALTSEAPAKSLRKPPGSISVTGCPSASSAVATSSGGQSCRTVGSDPGGGVDVGGIELVGLDRTNGEIAKSLGYSVPTIKKDLQHLMKLLGTHDRRSTAGRAREIGLLPELHLQTASLAPLIVPKFITRSIGGSIEPSMP